MTVATALILATGMVCTTALILVVLISRQARRLIREILEQIHVQGRKVSVRIDKKIDVEIDEDEPSE